MIGVKPCVDPGGQFLGFKGERYALDESKTSFIHRIDLGMDAGSEIGRGHEGELTANGSHEAF